jgi:hypothetical protein
VPLAPSAEDVGFVLTVIIRLHPRNPRFNSPLPCANSTGENGEKEDRQTPGEPQVSVHLTIQNPKLMWLHEMIDVLS